MIAGSQNGRKWQGSPIVFHEIVDPLFWMNAFGFNSFRRRLRICPLP
jgi:hypothetical protein